MKKITFLFFYLLSFNLFGQTFSFQLFSVKEGLEGIDLLCVTQDNQGYIWTGGILGINKFDGTKFTNYNSVDGLVNDKVLKIFTDKKERLWLATRNGVSLFNGQSFTNYPVLKDSAIDNKTLFGFCETNQLGFVDFGVKGVVQFKNNSFEKILPELKSVKAIIEDNNHNLWLGSNNGLYKYENGKLINYKIAETAVSNNITCMSYGDKGELWMGLGNGIARYYNNKIDTFLINTISYFIFYVPRILFRDLNSVKCITKN